MTTPAKLKLRIYQGATFKRRLVWASRVGNVDTPIDLTGCTARMQVRSEVGSPTVLLELNTTNGGVTLGGATGTIDLYISDEDTAAFAWDGGVFDLEITDSADEVVRLVQGSASVSPEVTRD